MKVDKASMRVGQGCLIFVLLVLYLALRSAIAEALNTNLFNRTLFFSIRFELGKVSGGKSVADSNCGIVMSLLPRAIAAQLFVGFVFLSP